MVLSTREKNANDGWWRLGGSRQSTLDPSALGSVLFAPALLSGSCLFLATNEIRVVGKH